MNTLNRCKKYFVFMMTVLLISGSTTVFAQEASVDADQNDAADSRVEKMQQLKQEQQLFQQELEEELREIKAEKIRLEQKYELLIQRHKNSLIDLEKKHKELDGELSVDQKKFEKSIQDEKQAIGRLKTQLELSQARADSALQSLQEKKKALGTELEVDKMEREQQLSDLQFEVQKTDLEKKLEEAEAGLNQARLSNIQLDQQLELARLETEKSRLQTEMSLNETRSRWKEKVVEPIQYEQEPLVNETLYITDRRINLNGPIIGQTGDWVSKRLHYFNNQSQENPIFIVIDDSPGGSVIEGFRIMKTMEAVEAPVYVVVKEGAMSMAAVITALADRSFAYPNAVILHHEVRSSMGGSLTETEEGLELMKRVWRRLATPVAEKMDMSLEEFRERLYEENSNGNWLEFASEAQDLNWVDHIITGIEDASVREEPSSRPPAPRYFFLQAGNDQVRRSEDGNFYRKLPPLRPHDFYFMYDPDNYYRW